MSGPRPGRGILSAAALLLMFAGSLGVWIGLPVLWLFVAGRVQGATGSLGAAVGAGLAGMVVSVVLALPVLHRLARLHNAAREARGREDLGWAPLEGVMTVSAVVALIAFGVWFFLLSGAEPVPVGAPK